jgi:hypothetical protein
MNVPGCHSMTTYGPVPTTGGRLSKNPSVLLGPAICAREYCDQTCSGRIGIYACVRRVVGNSVVATRVSPSQVTLSRPLLVRYGSR